MHYIVQQIPGIILWVVGLVLAVLMLRRSGGRAEKLFLAGCCLLLAKALADPVMNEIVTRFIWTEGMSNVEKALAMSMAYIPLSVIQIAGFVCLILAFWLRFVGRKAVAA